MIQNLSERAVSFVSEISPAHGGAFMDKRHPPWVPAEGGSVFSGGMWTFQREMTQGMKEGKKKHEGFSTKE